jgi:hypothetical protein
MNDRIPRSQGDHVLVDVKAKPSGGLRPALTPTPGAVRWQRAGRRPKGDPQIQVSTVSGDCRCVREVQRFPPNSRPVS